MWPEFKWSWWWNICRIQSSEISHFLFCPSCNHFTRIPLKKIDWKIQYYEEQVLEHHQMITLRPLQYFCHLNSPIMYLARSLKTRIEVLYTFYVQKIIFGRSLVVPSVDAQADGLYKWNYTLDSRASKRLGLMPSRFHFYDSHFLCQIQINGL